MGGSKDRQVNYTSFRKRRRSSSVHDKEARFGKGQALQDKYPPPQPHSGEEAGIKAVGGWGGMMQRMDPSKGE